MKKMVGLFVTAALVFTLTSVSANSDACPTATCQGFPPNPSCVCDTPGGFWKCPWV